MIGRPEQALRKAVAKLPPLDVGGYPPSERTWREHANRLRADILVGDPSDFLNWWVVRHTMYTVGHSEWAEPMLDYLRGLPDWASRWKPALREPDAGNPTWYGFDLRTSETAVCHAYCLARFETSMDSRITDWPAIFEFGGGYGGMRRLAHDLGFRGQYILYDLPPMIELARYYLKSSGYSRVSLTAGSDATFLDAMLDGAAGGALFVSTWALSETSLATRSRVLRPGDPFGAYLITYQDAFHEMDNVGYFVEWVESRPDVDWRAWVFDGNPGSHGIAGVRRGY